MRISSVVSTYNVYFSTILLFLLGISIAVAPYEKGELLRTLNQYQNGSLDLFFTVITALGNGFIIMAICVLLILFIRINIGVTALLAYASSGIVAQIIKRTMDIPRPRGYLTYFEQLKLMPDTYFATHYSFPSGHTTSAFAFFTVMAICFHTSKPVQLVLALIAILVGISRVYLLQHFFIDVIAGTVIGLLFGVLFSLLAMRKAPHKWNYPLIGSKRMR